VERDDKALSLFLSDLSHQVDQIEKIFSVLERKRGSLEEGPVSSEQVESTGYWLHNLYSAFEDLFKIVSGFWENSMRLDGGFRAACHGGGFLVQWRSHS
jgi:hypothetical protein